MKHPFPISNCRAPIAERQPSAEPCLPPRATPHASHTPHSALRTPHSQRGVALVITLVLLSVITFMAITFLVVSHGQHGAVAIETDQAVARFAADTARERAIAELLAPIMASANEFSYGLLASANYINSDGFDQTLPLPGPVNPTNVNYDYTRLGAPLNLNQQLQNLANLLYNPRPPVFITNRLFANSNEFRFYIDLNRNGRYDTNGFLPVISPNPALPFYDTNGGLHATPPPGNTLSSFFVGDPEWIGGLQRPEFAHSATNLFTHRYAYLVVPAGQTLDLNTIHNHTKPTSVPGNPSIPWSGDDGLLRNQGILTAEINLAALLVDLNTNQWPGPGSAPNAPYYNYVWSRLSVANSGAAFDDAVSFLRYRYGTNLNSLGNVQNLFHRPGATAFTNLIDGYSEGPVMTGTWWPPPGFANPNPTRVNGNYPWAGADNPNRFYTTQDLFDRNKFPVVANGRLTPISFVDRLLMAGTNIDSYNRYTFYRLLSQLGTDSAPEPSGKMNLNYCNVDNNGYVVPNMATNFIPWQPAQFFTNAAIRLLADAGYAVGAATSTSNLLVLGSNYVNGGFIFITNLHIPIWPINYYTPSVHRLLQLAANMYDATTIRTFNQPTATNGFPSVFRPIFLNQLAARGNGIFINGFAEVIDTSVLSQPWVDLNVSPRSVQPTSMVYGLPLVIGAKKGFPNFNEFAMRTAFTVTRKLEFLRQGGLNTSPIAQTNQMYLLTISNLFGIEAWNSYSNPYPRNLRLWVMGAPGDRDIKAYMTDVQGGQSYPVLNAYTNFFTNQTIAAYAWPGFIDQADSPSSVQYPLWTNYLTLTNSQYMQKTLPPYFVPVSGQGYTFERPSGFPSPDWWLTFTNRLRVALMDTSVNPNRIVDFVNLEACGAPVHITDLLGGAGCSGTTYSPSPNPSDEWCTNRGGVNVTSTSIPTFGVLNQWSMGIALTPNAWSSQQPNWAACDFFRTQWGLGLYHTWPAGQMTKTNTFYAPYVPTRTIYFYTSWQANDPLVHYTIPDLTDPSLKPYDLDTTSVSDPMQTFGTRNFLNERYRPWGGNPNKPVSETITSLTIKDPVALVALHWDGVGHSDDWDFPTNKFPNVGWLGRVHRGTPWQTVYLKSSSIDLGTWQTWTGNTNIMLNVGQTTLFSNNVFYSDAYFTQPTNDWRLLDLFTTALSDSATRGQLSINQTNLAAWSAVLSGVCVLTNSFDANGNPILAPQVIEPAGVYDPFNTNTWPPIVQIINGLNTMRTNFPNGAFHTLGDVLAAPVLTVASPFLNTSIPPSLAVGGANPNYVLSDEAFERLPQQILGLLKCDHTPRFVIYAFGQTLKPESTRAIVKSGPFAGLCTNYQVVAEAATRTVVRFEGVPPYQSGIPPAAITTLHPVIESFNVLPPD